MSRNILLLFFCVLCASASKGMIIQVMDAEVETVDSEYIKADIKIRKEGDINLLDIDVDAIKDLNSDLFLQLHLQKKTDEGLLSVYKTDVVDRCHFVDNMDKYPVLNELFQELKQYGNMMSPCPVLKGHYYLKGFKFEPKTELMKLLAGGEYVLHTLFMKEIDTSMRTLYSVKYHIKISN